MPTWEEGECREAAEATRAVVALLSAIRRLWHEAYPGLHRRAQLQLVSYLGTRARGGATVGELHGLVRQIFLLDDSTVKERIQEIARLGLARLDPPGESVSTRSVVMPEPALLDRFDAYLCSVAGEVLAAAGIAPDARAVAPSALDAAERALVQQTLDRIGEAWRVALERFFDAAGLSPARRAEAMRHLNATSHAALLHMAVEHRYGLSTLADDGEGLLADRMAAALLSLTGQNFQTSRDHLGYLMEVGLLARQPGRALRVALAEAAAPPLDAAFAGIAAALPALARDLAAALPPAAAADEEEEVRTLRRVAPHRLRHDLLVEAPGVPPRRVAVPAEGLTIGRLPPCDVLLPFAEVSRQHCRLELSEDGLLLTDLNSTNGTLVDGSRITGGMVLSPGAVVQVGACRLTCELRAVPDEASAEAPGDRTLRVRSA